MNHVKCSHVMHIEGLPANMSYTVDDLAYHLRRPAVFFLEMGFIDCLWQ